jgi:hypothetical protein
MFWERFRPALHAGLGERLGRRGVSRAQGRRDREWRQFVRDLTEPARQLSPAEDERMRAFLESHADDERRSEPPAERAA